MQCKGELKPVKTSFNAQSIVNYLLRRQNTGKMIDIK